MRAAIRRGASARLVLAAVLSAAGLLVTSAAAYGASTVPGAEYSVSFSGTGGENVSYSDQEEQGTQTGSWTVKDPAVPLWLPATQQSFEEDAASSQLTGVEAEATGTLSETGTYLKNNVPQNYSCSGAVHSVYTDRVSATVSLGSLILGSAYNAAQDTAPSPAFLVQVPGGESNAFPCNSDPQYGPTQAYFQYPGVEDGSQSIGVAATVPYGDVGQAEFTVPAHDESHITQSDVCISGGHGNCTGPNFQISGSYTLTKICDGTLTYSGSDVSGACGSTPPPSPSGGARPDTRITARAIDKRRRSAVFKFKAVGSATAFQCALVKQQRSRKHHKAAKPSFSSCKSPKAYKHLARGHYTFYVRAVGAGGVDLTPASARFSL